MKTNEEIMEWWCNQYGHFLAFDGDAIADLRTALEAKDKECEERVREERERIRKEVEYIDWRNIKELGNTPHEAILVVYYEEAIAHLLKTVLALTPTKTDKTTEV